MKKKNKILIRLAIFLIFILIAIFLSKYITTDIFDYNFL